MTVTLHDHEPAVGEPLPGSPAASPSTEAAETTTAPVFVDSSGRRQRRVRRLGVLLAVPAVGYLGLLASTVLGGPTVNAPFLPLPQPPAAAPTPAPAPEPTDPAPTDLGTEGPDSVQPAPARPTTVVHHPAAPTTAARPTVAAVPVGLPSPAAPPPTATPTPGGNGNGNGGATSTQTPGHGRPTDPPGNSGGKPPKP
ncbi:hypothetical protein [Kitasatospora sp. NPDC097643]|uniref:hypothetical protein n=1 Tax=Kitasatospora sp. NPDC097643 TaxID=3157230 RepID=UPI00331C9D98